MINFKGKEGIIFNFRVAALIVDNEYVLLHKSEKDGFWSLPGGRVEFGEKTEDTVIRELREEVNIEAKVIRLLWYVEDFYTYEGEPYHEIALYYLVDIDNLFKNKSKEYYGIEGKKKLIYRWHEIEKLNNLELYPIFLRNKIGNLRGYIEKIIQE